MKRKYIQRLLITHPPEYILILTCLLFFSVIRILQVLLQIDLYPVNKTFLGFDLKDFYEAAHEIMNGRNPYNVRRYVTPPYFALLLSFFGNFSFDSLKFVFLGVNILLLILTTILLINQFNIKNKLHFVLTFILITTSSFPYLFLIDRGNIDLLILFLLTLMLVYYNTNDYLSGLFLGISILLKLYPVLLFLPLFILKKKKIIITAILLISISIILHFKLWSFYFEERLMSRILAINLFENASIFSLSILLGKFTELFGINIQHLFISFGLVFYFVFLFINLWYDKNFLRKLNKTGKKELIIKYFVFLVQLPFVVFQYEYVILFVIIPYLRYIWENIDESKRENYSFVLSVLALAITLFPTIEFYKIIDSIKFLGFSMKISKLVFVIPSLGLIVLTVCLTLLSKEFFYDSAKNVS